MFRRRWQKISDPRSVTEILKQVYTDHTTKVDEVYSRIIETTRHPAAAASFASIIFAPQGQLTFDETLNRWAQISCIIFLRNQNLNFIDWFEVYETCTS